MRNQSYDVASVNQMLFELDSMHYLREAAFRFRPNNERMAARVFSLFASKSGEFFSLKYPEWAYTGDTPDTDREACYMAATIDVRAEGRLGSVNRGLLEVRVKDYAPSYLLRFLPGALVKNNPCPRLTKIETSVAQRLSGYHETNFCSAVPGNGSIEEVLGPTLMELAEHNFYRTHVLDATPPLVREAVKIAHLLTGSVLSQEEKDELTALKRQKFRLPDMSTYETAKLTNALQLSREDASLFREAFLPIQRYIVHYNEAHALWISDRSYVNRANKNFDANCIEEASLARELVRIFEMVPDKPVSCPGVTGRNSFIEPQRKRNLIEHAISTDNLLGGSLCYDDDFYKAYMAERFVKSVMNMTLSLNDASKEFNEQAGSIFFFQYARSLEKAMAYMGMALESLGYLRDENLVTHSQESSLTGIIRKSYGTATDSRHFHQLWSPQDYHNDICHYYGDTINFLHAGVIAKCAYAKKRLQEQANYTKRPI